MSPLGHNFACVAYFYTVASFWFREQLYSLNVVGFIFFVFTRGFSGFLFFRCCCFILSMPPTLVVKKLRFYL